MYAYFLKFSWISDSNHYDVHFENLYSENNEKLNKKIKKCFKKL